MLKQSCKEARDKHRWQWLTRLWPQPVEHVQRAFFPLEEALALVRKGASIAARVLVLTVDEPLALPAELGPAVCAAHERTAASSLDLDAAYWTLLGVKLLPDPGERLLPHGDSGNRTLFIAMTFTETARTHGGVAVWTCNGGRMHVDFAHIALQKLPAADFRAPRGSGVAAMLYLGAKEKAPVELELAHNASHLAVRDELMAQKARQMVDVAVLYPDPEPRAQTMMTRGGIALRARPQRPRLGMEANLTAPPPRERDSVRLTRRR
ncbi:hypothetical protein FGB62_71g017 [Gracilaria domingensis]|nr:hypothetical protein FGB62_71g017 [Gracilaria domingensis]